MKSLFLGIAGLGDPFSARTARSADPGTAIHAPVPCRGAWVIDAPVKPRHDKDVVASANGEVS